MTLAIESGPGEFPTGPSITFAPDSDIAIRDGEAAMEFRSYLCRQNRHSRDIAGIERRDDSNHFARRTKIHRRQNAAGETASVCAFHRHRRAAASLMTFGLNNPTRASSEAPGHSGRLANDGNAATFWQADAGDANRVADH